MNSPGPTPYSNGSESATRPIRPWDIVQGALFIAGFLMVVVVAWRLCGRILDRQVRLPWPELLVTLPVAIAFPVVRALLWHGMAAQTIGRFPLRTNMAAWLCASIGKYIPGKVFLFLGRVSFYRPLDVAPAPLGAAMVLEEACCAVGACTLFMAALASRGAGDGAAQWLAPAAAALVMLLLVSHPKFLLGALNAVLKKLRRAPATFSISWGSSLLFAAGNGLNWMMLGWGVWHIARASFDLPASTMPYMAGAFAAAAYMGLVAFFIPAGLGVREGVFVALVAPLTSLEDAIILALVTRLWVTVGELLPAMVAIVGVGMRRWRGKSLAS